MIGIEEKTKELLKTREAFQGNSLNKEELLACLDASLDLNQTLLKKAKEYERIIHDIANIDTIFFNEDGTVREFNEREALGRIERLVMPIWNAYCEEGFEDEWNILSFKTK